MHFYFKFTSAQRRDKSSVSLGYIDRRYFEFQEFCVGATKNGHGGNLRMMCELRALTDKLTDVDLKRNRRKLKLIARF